MRTLRTPLLRTAFRVAYRTLRVYWLIARPRMHGVKCVLARRSEVLLVRHTYGRRERWELPGGGVKRHEAARDAARRETREELGIDVEDWTFLGDLFDRIDHKRDTLSCFRAEIGEATIRPDPAEIAEARWFARDRLPENTGKHVVRIAALADVAE